MSEALPSQLPWRRFEAILTKLGYKLYKSARGASRTYYNPHREPHLVTFHEPHSPNTLAKGTLREYIRKLRLSHQEFSDLLKQT